MTNANGRFQVVSRRGREQLKVANLEVGFSRGQVDLQTQHDRGNLGNTTVQCYWRAENKQLNKHRGNQGKQRSCESGIIKLFTHLPTG